MTGTIFQVLLLLLKFFLEKSAKKNELLKVFYQFVEQLYKNNSADLTEEEKRQLADIENFNSK